MNNNIYETEDLFDSFNEEEKSKGLVKDNKGKELDKYKSFMPSPFITAALPARNVNKPLFVRKYNNVELKITASTNVPYGKYGRLLLTILTTHAVINKNKNPNEPVLVQYKSLNQLMRELQLPTSRCNDIRDMLTNFAGASFVFTERKQKVTQASLFKDLLDDNSGLNMNDQVTATKYSSGLISFIKSIRYIDIEDRKGEKATAAIDIVLNEDFVKFSQEHSVPINYSVYKDITSNLGKDLYAWFVYRINYIKEPLHISRYAMVEQFIPVSENKQTEKDVKDQARSNWQKIKEQITIIKEKYYPELNVSFDADNAGITIFPSQLPIQANDQRYILVTTNPDL